MTDTLAFGAHFAVIYVIIFITYLWYREWTRAKPMTFLELFMYMEGFKEDIGKIVEEENGETRKEMFNNSLKTYDRIKNILNDGKS